MLMNNNMHYFIVKIPAQLFEGGLALNPGLNLTRVSFTFVQKAFSPKIFSVISKSIQSSTC